MRCGLMSCFVVLLVVLVHSRSVLDCHNVCAHRHHHTHLELAECGCPHGHNITTFNATTPPTTPTTVTTTTPHPTQRTLSMCDYLCAIQQGGAACDCSMSILPGK